ncbi:MAG: O-antigen ligase family protein [Bacteroidales bacterium]|nr:O-antigen ligase family protein [Bacteroidales bacterium]
MIFTPKAHRLLYILALAITACSLPFSVYTTSIGTIILVANFLLEGNWRFKAEAIKTNKLLWISLLVYTPLLYSFFYSTNTAIGLKELRLWLPFVFVPIVVALSNKLNHTEFQFILLSFVLAVFVATAISTTYLLGIASELVIDTRRISLFISHIRFSMMVNLAIAILIHLAFSNNHFKKPIRILFIAVAIWLTAFLFVLKAFTGIAMLALLVAMGTIWILIKQRNRIVRFVVTSIALSMLLIIASTITHKVDRFYTRHRVNLTQLNPTTANGNPYTHDTLRKIYENGHLLYINICYPELRNEWQRRSTVPFDSTDAKGQPLSQTIIRYITSLGHTKDSAGIWKLDSLDINLIEHGATSVIFKESTTGFDARIYQLLWEFDAYRSERNISYSSVVQRMVFAKAAWFVVKNNFWLGVGWGDIRDSMSQYYQQYEPSLPETLWLMPHNQYLTVWTGSGLLGLIIFLIALCVPFVTKKMYRHFLPLYFFAMVMVSMLNEDTFETHIGITFATIFISLFIFGDTFPHKPDESKSINS